AEPSLPTARRSASIATGRRWPSSRSTSANNGSFTASARSPSQGRAAARSTSPRWSGSASIREACLPRNPRSRANRNSARVGPGAFEGLDHFPVVPVLARPADEDVRGPAVAVHHEEGWPVAHGHQLGPRAGIAVDVDALRSVGKAELVEHAFGMAFRLVGREFGHVQGHQGDVEPPGHGRQADQSLLAVPAGGTPHGHEPRWLGGAIGQPAAGWSGFLGEGREKARRIERTAPSKVEQFHAWNIAGPIDVGTLTGRSGTATNAGPSGAIAKW